MRQKKKLAPISPQEREFFDEFLKEFEGFLVFTAKKYQCPGIQLEDVVQEAELRLLMQIPTLQRLNHNTACSYIAHTVQTSFYDLYRKQVRHPYVSMDSMLEEMIGMEYDLIPDLFLRQEIQRLRKGLSPRQWLALKGKYVFGYSQEELGKQLDIAPDSVRTFLSRARMLARQILSPEKVTGGGDND